MQWVMLAVGLVIGSAVGAAVMQARGRSRAEGLRIRLAQLETERQANEDKLAWTERAKDELREAFAALASKSLSENSQQYLVHAQRELKKLVDPLTQSLDKMDQSVRSIESKREGAYQKLGEQLRSLGDAQSTLQRATVTLEQSLKSSTVRGRWGELQLRRVVELAGMTKHVDFHEQVSGEQGRPDMVVQLPSGGIIPIDAKAPAASYLSAMESEGEARTQKLVDHAKALRSRVQALSKKSYMEQFETAPEIVVLFVPFESALSAAFEQDASLLEYAITQRILVASPVTLLALLRSAAFGWQQYHIEENARSIADQGRELYVRFLNVVKPFADVGEKLRRAVDSYNQSIGSMESRLMPALRRLKDSTAAPEELPQPEPIDRQARLPLDDSDR